jgi:hypothetical protein
MYEMRTYAGEDLAIGRTHDEFERAITAALHAETPERARARSARAAANTWEHRIDEISSLLAPIIGESASAPNPAHAAVRTEAAG